MTKIGAEENEYAKIFLNPQTWAVLANIFDVEKLNNLMDIVEEKLISMDLNKQIDILKKELADKTVTLRKLGQEKQESMPLDAFVEMMKDSVKMPL